jgi:competence protein ComEC
MANAPTIARQPDLASHPLAALAVSFVVGVIVARFTSLPLKITLTCLGMCSVLVIYFFVKQRQGSATLMLLVAFSCAGATLGSLEKRGVSRERVQRFYDEGLIASGDPVEVTGVLERAPESAPDGFYLALRVEKLRFKDEERSVSGSVSLFAPVYDRAAGAEYDALELRYGARVRVMTALRRSENFRNPGVSSFTEYLEQRGFDATGTIKSALLVERLDDERVFLPLAWLYEWRQRLLSRIGQTFSPETAGVLDASLLGNRYYLSQGAAERFREGGTFHVLVISGLHISFIGLVALLVMRRITRRRAWQFAASVSLLWAYTLAVGAEAAVVRAALMFTVVALAPVLHRRAASLNALGGACLALLVWRPGELFDPSFQLTFLSVLAIVVIAWPVLRRLEEVGAWRPTHETPSPPVCARWWRLLGEMLFWSEREWRREMSRSTWHCRLFKTPLAARLEKLHVQRLLRYMTSVVIVSAAVQIVLLPFLVLYFHRLSLASIVLNIVVGVLMAALSFTALAALALLQVSSAMAAPLVSLAEGLSWLMVHSVDPLMGARLATVRLPEYSGWASMIYGLYYVPLVVLSLALARWKPLQRVSSREDEVKFAPTSQARWAGCALLSLLVLIVSHPLSAGRPDGRLHVDFLDVGQGDAALVTMPDGTTLLVDGGGRPRFDNARRGADEDNAIETFERDRRSIGEAVVSEYLWWRGLSQVDYLVATHADADHIDGLNDVARNFKVRGALVARTPASDAEYARFAASLQRQRVPVELIARGDSLRFGAVTVDVLWPLRVLDANAASRNNDSVVLRLRFGERVFLLTGDIESKAEAMLARAPLELRCDVVKVAHHGSKTSSSEDFVKAARPSLALISVGLYSSYGHPHREVVERWRANGAEVLTTGERGAVSISTDGRDLRVETFINGGQNRLR